MTEYRTGSASGQFGVGIKINADAGNSPVPGTEIRNRYWTEMPGMSMLMLI
jgi:hypothetical protein